MKLMEDLIHMLNEASKAYYNGESTMTDIEYDKLFDELKSLEERTGLIYSNSPTQKVGATVLDHLTKKTIDIQPMLSLDKVHSAEEVVEFAKKKTMVAMLKCDGLSVRLIYKNGKLEKAVTRGNGEEGEVITNNAKVFKNVPLSIAHQGELVLRGEAVISYSEFEKINESISDADAKYKNPRNLCSGSVRQLNSEITAKRNVRFYAFSLVQAKGTELSNEMEERFSWLSSLGFDVVEYKPDSAFGINCWAGEHLNFISKNKLDELKDKLKKKSIHLKNDFDSSAVWKDKTTGVIKKSTAGTFSNGDTGTFSNGDTGTSYGNGTSQFVLGYATEEGVNGYIETAQLK